jgi:hypothetical protein
VQLIDFEKAQMGSSLLDLCWLSLSMLMSAASRVPRPSLNEWWLFPSSFVDLMLGDNTPDQELGVLQLGLDLSARLVEPLNRLPESIADPQTAGFFAFRIKDQMALSLGITAMAMSYYEGRGLQRAYDRGEDLDSEGCLRHLRWSVSFFRVAALALGRYAAQVPTEPGIPNIARLLQRFE